MNQPEYSPTQPLVTVGIPTYNGGEDLYKAVGSIFSQGFASIEVVISDNASTDDGLTERVCRDLESRYPNLRYYRQKAGIGIWPNWDFVLQHARGKYFMWLADDDEVSPGVIEQYVDFLETHPDYSLASGSINYWQGDLLIRQEKGLSLEGDSPKARTRQYYWNIIDGAMVYGLMRTDIAQQIPQKDIIGMDWHHVAALAFAGKIKQFDFIGYEKWLGGTSANFVNYAKKMGLPGWWGKIPYVRMALDAQNEIVNRLQVYQTLSKGARKRLAFSCGLGILYNWYINRLPRKIGGSILRALHIKTPKERMRERLNQNLNATSAG